MNKRALTAVCAVLISSVSHAQFSTSAEAQGRLNRQRQQSVLLAVINQPCRRYAQNSSNRYEERGEQHQADIVQSCTRGAVDGLTTGSLRPGLKSITDAIQVATAEEAATLTILRNAYMYGHRLGENARRLVRTGGLLEREYTGEG